MKKSGVRKKRKKLKPVPERVRKKPRKIMIVAKPATESRACQMCSSTDNIAPYHIGGVRNPENTIMLCKEHMEQAENGFYSDSLLKRLKIVH